MSSKAQKQSNFSNIIFVIALAVITIFLAVFMFIMIGKPFVVKEYSDIKQLTVENYKTYDKKHTEYYVIVYNDDETMEAITLFVVVNKDYNFPFKIIGTKINGTISNYSVSYTERYTEEDGLFFVDTTGEILVGNERVFIEYNGVDFEKRSNFITYLSRIIC